MDDFDIGLRKSILDSKHISQMGSAIWLYMWCISHMTKVDGKIGLVLGGKPIKYEDTKIELGLSRTTYWRYLDILEKYEYVSAKRTPYGLIIHVTNARKTFKQRVVPELKQPVVSDMKHLRSNSDVPELKHLDPIIETSDSEIETSNKDTKVVDTKVYIAQTLFADIQKVFKQPTTKFETYKTDVLVALKDAPPERLLLAAKSFASNPYWDERKIPKMDKFFGKKLGSKWRWVLELEKIPEDIVVQSEEKPKTPSPKMKLNSPQNVAKGEDLWLPA